MRSYICEEETGLYYLQSRYYDPQTHRFLNADEFPATGQGVLGNNMFAYCGNNPISRIDASGYFWGTLITIGIGAIASVVSSAVSAAINGDDFTVGDAIGAAISGGMATMMTLAGLPAVLTNPVATFCGGVIGKCIDGDISEESLDEVCFDTVNSGLMTAAFGGFGKLASKYADSFLNGKYAKLNMFEEFVKDLTYKPKFLDKSSIQTITTNNLWESVQSVAVNIIFE